MNVARLVVSLTVVLMLAGCQDMFVYHPVTEDESVLLEQAESVGLEAWPESGEGRMGWRTAAPDGAEHRVVVFHGNGGHALHRDYLVRGFQSMVDGSRWEIFLVEYPGYGSRPGSPGEETLVQAGTEAVERLLDEDAATPIYLVGESLGSGVATQVAARFGEAVPAVLLITPFTNLEDAGATTFPRFLVRSLLRDRYDNEAALESYEGRVGVLLAGRDQVVPAELGRRLYDGYDGPKRLWVQEEAGHNSLDYSPHSPWWEEAGRFLQRGE